MLQHRRGGRGVEPEEARAGGGGEEEASLDWPEVANLVCRRFYSQRNKLPVYSSMSPRREKSLNEESPKLKNRA